MVVSKWVLGRLEKEISDNQARDEKEGKMAQKEALGERGLEGEGRAARHLVQVAGEVLGRMC